MVRSNSSYSLTVMHELLHPVELVSFVCSANNRESVGLAPLRPPYPLQSNAPRFDHSMVTDDII